MAAASISLRRGLVHALSCTSSDKPITSNSTPIQQPLPVKRKQADPHAVYTALLSKKEAGWSATKKAGPSILAKKEKKKELPPPPAPKRARIEKPPPAPAPKPLVKKSIVKLQPFVKVGPQKKRPAEKVADAKVTDPLPKPKQKKENATVVGLNSESVKEDTKVDNTKSKGGEPLTSGPVTLPLPSARKSILKKPKLTPLSFTKPSNSKSQQTVTSPGGSQLPSTWSQVPGKSSSQQKSKTTGLFLKPSLGLSTSTIFSTGLQTSKQSALSSVIAGTRAITADPKLSRPSSESVMPLPNSYDMRVKQIPGSEPIRGVLPNGYTVSREGVVKPVVAFSPKPKVPHKLRQTSLDKFFEGYQNIQKLKEADALSKSLRLEQELYAESPSRVEYRAAVTVKLREIRKTP